MALDTDGFGRSDPTAHLRRIFEVDRNRMAHVTIAKLADEGLLMKAQPTKTI